MNFFSRCDFFFLKGSNSNVRMGIIYNTIAWTIGFVFPMSASILIYFLIKLRLHNKVAIQTSKNSKANSQKLALQLILINIFEIISFLSLILIYVILITGSGGTLIQIIVGIIHTLCLASLPILTLVFLPIKLNLKCPSWLCDE